MSTEDRREACGSSRTIESRGVRGAPLFEQPDEAAASAQLRRVADSLATRFPAVAASLIEAEPDLLVHFTFPEARRRQIRSTNPQERLNKEIKRRTAVVGIFPTRASLIRLVRMVLFEQDDEWQDGRRYFRPESMARIDAVTVPEDPHRTPAGGGSPGWGAGCLYERGTTVIGRVRVAQGIITTHISRPADDIFAVLADVSQNARWASSAVEGRQTSPGPVGVGTKAREVSTFLGRRIEVDSVVTEFIAGRRLAYRTTGGPFPFSGSFDVAAEGDGARVTATFEAKPAGVFAVLGPLFPRLVTRALRRDLASLKRLMESGELQ